MYTCICAHTVSVMREYYRFITLQLNLQCFVEKHSGVIDIGKDSIAQHKRDEYTKYKCIKN